MPKFVMIPFRVAHRTSPGWGPARARVVAFLAVLMLASCWHSSGLLWAQSGVWTRLPGPFGGDVVGIAEADDGTLYTATYGAGIYRSTDDGASWDVRFNGSGSYHPVAAYNDGTVIAISEDNTWIVRNYSEFGSWFRFEFYFPLNARYAWDAAAIGGSLFLGTDNGLGVTRDTGTTWEPVAFEGLAVRTLVSTGSILAGLVQPYGPADTSWLLVRSDDSGMTWHSIPLSPDLRKPDLEARDGVVAVRFAERGLFVWPAESDTLVPFDTSEHATGNAQMALFDKRAIALLRPDDRALILLNGSGGTVAHQALPAWAGTANTLHVASDGSLLSGTNGSGVYRSIDSGETWNGTGLSSGASFYDLLLSPGGALLGSVRNRGIVRMNGDGAWSDLGPSERTFASIGVDSIGWLWGAAGKELFRSTDDGNHWEKVETGFAKDINVLVCPDASTILLGVTGGILQSNDGGVTWKQVYSEVSVEFIEKGLEETIWGAGLNVACRSTDGGDTWTTSKFFSSPLVGNAESFMVARNGSVFVQGFDFRYRLLRSTDEGATWKSLAGGCNDWGFDAMTETGEGLFGLNWCGVYQSIDNGESWHMISGIPENFTTIVAVPKRGGGMYVGTEQGVYLFESGISSVNEDKGRSAKLDLR